MRRLILALLLLVLPAPSSAQVAQKKIAVVIATQVAIGSAGTVSEYWTPTINLLDRLGIAYDLYDCANRTYGQMGPSGVADSTWFRERYAAVLIPYFQKNNNRASVWFTGWRNTAATADSVGWEKGPAGGKWSIPVYAMNSLVGYRAESMTPGSVDSLRMGVAIIGGTLSTNGSRAMTTAPESLGTWRDRVRSRIGGRSDDTLYVRPDNVHFLSTAFGSQVAALTWHDTTATSMAPAADTLANTHRYKPLADKPGIVWTMLPNIITTSDTRFMGSMVLLELMIRECGLLPMAKLPVSFTIHHPGHKETPTAVADALIDLHLDALERGGIYSYGAVQVSPVEWTTLGAGGTTTGLNRIRDHMRDGWMKWHPHSHATAWDYNETDSVGMRVAFNAMLNTATHPDSFRLPRSAYSPRRIVPANDVMTDAATATASRAGMKVAEVVLHAYTGAEDRHALPRYSNPRAIRPGGTTNTVWLVKSFDAGFQVNDSTFRTTLGMAHRIRQTPMFALESAVYTGGSVYWHMDYLVANTGIASTTGDGSQAWIPEKVFGSYLRQFSSVVEIDKFGSPVSRVRARYTPGAVGVPR